LEESGKADRRKSLGARAEDHVAGWLAGNGYTVVCKNYRCHCGEIDIIARKGRFICFIEVRSRSTTAMGSPSLTVDRRKQSKIVRTAMYYMAAEKPGDLHGRFDVAAVTFGPDDKVEIEYLPAAFEAGS
jgi:putative endonuclease